MVGLDGSDCNLALATADTRRTCGKPARPPPGEPGQGGKKEGGSQGRHSWVHRGLAGAYCSLTAEVGLLYLGISPKRCPGAAEEDAPRFDDVGAIRDLE